MNKQKIDNTKQRKWQIKNRLNNRCMICGEKIYKAQRCKKHYDYHKKYQRERYRALRKYEDVEVLQGWGALDGFADAL